ncbi:CU044_2847 family protein [Phytohabitans aurantiacus]|uniref:CU044_2847 family protein n=1 Tax=Phytohabitans aurantiacus TaxID=3016789 RepID=UPI00389AA617
MIYTGAAAVTCSDTRGPDHSGRSDVLNSALGLSFALDLQAEAGVIVSRASASASFEVSLTWARMG